MENFSLSNKDNDRIRRLADSSQEKRVANSILTMKNPVLIHAYLLEAIFMDSLVNKTLQIPQAIKNNENCDLGTALLLFKEMRGCDYLIDKNMFELNNEIQIEWAGLLNDLFGKISAGDFKYKMIQHSLNLGDEMKDKLKSQGVPEIFYTKSPGNIIISN